MSHENKSTLDTQELGISDGLARATVLTYGVISYTVGVAGLAALVAAMAGFVPPAYQLIFTEAAWQAALVNVGLVLLFGLQHSVMARPGFKEKWTQIVPAAAERPTYVLFSGLALFVLVGLWQPMPSLVWDVQQPALRAALWGLFVFGWLYLLAATFAIDHFDLFGLRQVYLFSRGRDYKPVPFKKRWMYRFSRHPIQAGVLIGIWATPVMTAGHLIMSTALTAYIAAGLWFEERDLINNFGERYLQYKREVGAFLTMPWRRHA